MTASPDTTHAALAAVLDAPDLATAKAVAQAGLDRIEADPSRFAPFKVALTELRVSEATLYRRVRAGAGELVNGRWIVDLQIAAEMGRRGR